MYMHVTGINFVWFYVLRLEFGTSLGAVCVVHADTCLHVFVFLVPRCDIRYNFRVKTIFDSCICIYFFVLFRLHSLNPTYPQFNQVSVSNINGGFISSWKILLKLRENLLNTNFKSSGTVVKEFLYPPPMNMSFYLKMLSDPLWRPLISKLFLRIRKFIQGKSPHYYNSSLDRSIIRRRKDVQIHNRNYHVFFSKAL